MTGVISDETVYASSEIGGRILSVNVKEGQQVFHNHLDRMIALILFCNGCGLRNKNGPLHIPRASKTVHKI